MTTRKTKLNTQDHDLLIRMDEKLNLLVQSFNSHKKETDDRISFLEKIVWSGMGALAVMQGCAFVFLKFWS